MKAQKKWLLAIPIVILAVAITYIILRYNSRVIYNPVVKVFDNGFRHITLIYKEIEAKITESTPSASKLSVEYPVHKDVTTTFFWVGEPSDEDNHFIPNKSSAWDEEWMKRYGGPDDPSKRKGYEPSGFEPKENPFYFALPYNDFDNDGERKGKVKEVVPWFKSKNWGEEESALKNRWIEIKKGDKKAYAQWEDVGPFGESDYDYVFGSANPKSKSNENAGLDVSPAVKDYLGLKDIDKTSWRFIEEKDVPGGPWKEVITRSQINWK